MKPSLLVTVGIVAAAFTSSVAAQDAKSPPAGAARPGSLQDPAAQAAYAIDFNLGLSLHRDGVAIDADILARGLRDGLAGASPALTEDQMRAAVTQLQTSVQARRQEKAAHAAQTNQAEGAAFLKANALKPGVVSLPDGLQYQILKPGAGPTLRGRTIRRPLQLPRDLH